MKKSNLLILFLMLTMNMVSCAQSSPAETSVKKQILKDESHLMATNDAEFGTFLKAMKTDSMIEKLELLSKFIRSNSEGNSLDEYTSKGLSFSNLKWYDSALVYFTLAININDKDPYLYYFRGDTYCKKHNFNKAIDDFTRAIRLDQSFYMAFYFRGICYYALGDVNKAMEDLTKTFKLVKASMKTA